MSAGDADALVRVFSLCSKQACRLDFLFLFDQAKRKEESHTDHLGSYIALTNSSGKIFQRNCFDVWGNLIPVFKVDTAGGASDTTLINFTLTNRGFTGHEHYPFFKIINMNGRLYDPVIGRFFSPDQFVQLPEFTQSFNRYSYCLNNPLKYTDPTGQMYKDVDDIYVFKEDGSFVERISESGFDQIRVIKNNGTTVESKKFDFGFLDNIMSFHNKEGVNIAGLGKLDLKGLSMNFGENLKGAMAAFRFLAANTTPEWSAFGRGDFKGGSENILATTHRKEFEYFGSEMAKGSAPIFKNYKKFFLKKFIIKISVWVKLCFRLRVKSFSENLNF